MKEQSNHNIAIPESIEQTSNQVKSDPSKKAKNKTLKMFNSKALCENEEDNFISLEEWSLTQLEDFDNSNTNALSLIRTDYTSDNHQKLKYTDREEVENLSLNIKIEPESNSAPNV